MRSDGMRQISYNMHEDAIKQFIEDVENQTDGNLDINEFLGFMEKKIQNDQRVEEELIDAFKVFDRDSTGYVCAEELRDLLMSGENQLTTDEFEMCIREEDITDGNRINYVELVRNMIER